MNIDWQRKSLGEIAQIGAGNSAPQEDELFANGTYPFSGHLTLDAFDLEVYLSRATISTKKE